MHRSKIRDDYFFVTYGWMVNQMKLKGIELQIFSIIYGFDRDGMGSFTGSLQYLIDFTNCSKNTILKALKELVEKRYIVKTENTINGKRLCTYRINAPLVHNVNQGGEETALCYSAEIEPVDGAVSEPNKELHKKYFTENKIVEDVIDSYHKICISFPKVVSITKNRRKEILSRLKNYSLKDMEKVFVNAENSLFLKGSNGGWKASFDWLMKEKNFIKVLEEKYADRQRKTVPGWSETTFGEAELEAIQRVLKQDFLPEDLACEV